MTYFEDFYATSAEFPHPTLTSSATLHPSPTLKVLNSPNAPASPPYLPTALSKQENQSETLIWFKTQYDLKRTKRQLILKKHFIVILFYLVSILQ